MKKIVSYISVLGLALAFNACENDWDKVTYDESQAKAAVLESVGTSYVLDAQQSDEVVFTMKWSEPNVGYEAAITNNVEMDLAGKDFSGKVVVASLGKGGQYAFTHSELNNSLLGLLDNYGMDVEAVDVEFRIASSISDAISALYSNTVTVNVTPFVGERVYPSIAVRGNYNGWDFKSSQKVYSANSDDSYSGMIYFNGQASGWKFCEDEGWSINWGTGDGATAEQSPITLVVGGGDIAIYSHNSYYFEFDKGTAELKVSKAHDSWGVVGGHNGWGSGDTVMTLGSETDNAGNVQFFLEATLDMDAGNLWKIRPDETWTDDIGPSAVEGDFIDNGDSNFRVDEAGNYTIKWYFNKVKQQVVVVKN